MKAIIETQKLGKRFARMWAVKEVDYRVYKGEIFGLLGPNAAGKSTSIRLLSGILKADSGSGSVLGFDLQHQVEKIKQNIGYVAQHFALYPELSVQENLSFYAGIYKRYGTSNSMNLLEAYGLEAYRNQKAGELSGGYKRRLSVACALVHDPELIFLDEPTAGIDPLTRKELWDLFFQLAARGKTLFITTHYMEEAERCSRLAFINHGQLIIEGTPEQIKASLDDYHIYATDLAYHPELTSALKQLPAVKVLNQFGNELRVVSEKSFDADSWRRLLQEKGIPAPAIRQVKATMEDAFITLTREQ